VQISQLENKKVGLWGWGREGRAAFQALRSRFPTLPLTLFCPENEVSLAQQQSAGRLSINTEISGASLADYDVIIKSPGISAYKPEALEAQKKGTLIISGTRLWFSQLPIINGYAANTIAITGTKGKSTTSSLLAYLLRSAGFRTALAGNIGLPLLELVDKHPPASYQVVELSSYQTRDVAASGVRPDIAVVLNLFAEHLDWHGHQQRYIDDKLSLLYEGQPRIAILNATDPILSKLSLPHSEIIWFNHKQSWHMRESTVFYAEQPICDTRYLSLLGQHNRNNLCAVLAVLSALAIKIDNLETTLSTFQALPHRLQWLGKQAGLDWVNDSISTTPYASLAALNCFTDKSVALIIGGFDRGLDWHAFAQHMTQHAPHTIITQGANGPAIYALLKPLTEQGHFQLHHAADLPRAVTHARTALQGLSNGLVLLSPGAPSFDAYRDYVHRGRCFAELAGFDPDSLSSISGLGIA